jgi:hypothetical protein
VRLNEPICVDEVGGIEGRHTDDPPKAVDFLEIAKSANPDHRGRTGMT